MNSSAKIKQFGPWPSTLVVQNNLPKIINFIVCQLTTNISANVRCPAEYQRIFEIYIPNKLAPIYGSVSLIQFIQVQKLYGPHLQFITLYSESVQIIEGNVCDTRVNKLLVPNLRDNIYKFISCRLKCLSWKQGLIIHICPTETV